MHIVTADKVAAAWGIVVAVVGPSIAIAAWFILTWNYRCEKKIITDELIRRLKVSDVCEVDSYLNGGSLGGHAEPSPETKKTAQQITRRCLRRWDGFMGFRASSNSGGIRAGIWRDKFDTVRCAVLLLAFRKLNQALQADHSFSRADCPGASITIGVTGCLCSACCQMEQHAECPTTSIALLPLLAMDNLLLL